MEMESTMTKTITLAIGENGELNIILGGEIPSAQGVMVCRAAADWFQQQAIEAEVQRRLEAARQEEQENEKPPPQPSPE